MIQVNKSQCRVVGAGVLELPRKQLKGEPPAIIRLLDPATQTTRNYYRGTTDNPCTYESTDGSKLLLTEV